jgi:thioredoxin-dependent peroxiredoxin
MEWLIITIILLPIGVVFLLYTRRKNPLKSGQSAPDFKLADQHGKIHRLEEFQGAWLALYFYPKDDTPGCTKQACTFRDDLKKLAELGAKVIGISVDNTLSHADFAKKYNLQFPLLADSKAEIAEKYFSLINLGIIKFAQRNTFLIDPQGNIAKVYLSVSATHNSADVIEDLKRLQAM